jgi:RNA polymerase sigma-70 factor (ECF subfamily)
MDEKTNYELLHGDSDDFTELYNRYSNQIERFLYLYKLVRNPSDVDDILQLVWARVHANKDKYNQRWAFSTWLSRLSLRVALNFYRDQGNLSVVSNYNLETLVDPHDVEDPLVIEEIQREVRSAVGKLPEAARLGIEAVFLEHTHRTRSAEHVSGWKRGKRLLRSSLGPFYNKVRIG